MGKRVARNFDKVGGYTEVKSQHLNIYCALFLKALSIKRAFSGAFSVNSHVQI